MRLPLEIDVFGGTESVHGGADCLYESSAVMAGILSFVPMALHESPS